MMEDAITKQEHRGGYWYTFGSLGENRTPRRLNGVGNRDPEDGGHYHQSVTPKRTGRDTDDKRQFSQGELWRTQNHWRTSNNEDTRRTLKGCGKWMPRGWRTLTEENASRELWRTGIDFRGTARQRGQRRG